ncbi:MAG: PIG-L deacetylase family protein [Acidimicrobiales bacterium]
MTGPPAAGVGSPVSIDVHAGTPEADWRAAGIPEATPLLSLEGATHIVVVAAHPDDEVLAVGATLRRLGDAGARLELVAVTDGEGSHPGSGAVEPAELAALRPAESAEALRRLQVHLASEQRLGLPDGRLHGRVPELAGRLAEIADRRTWLLVSWRGDGHPDHEAVGRAGAQAAARCGARLIEYPLWAWTWAAPWDPRVPWGTARAVPLTPALRRAKAHAVQAFRSQISALGPGASDGPVLPPGVLEHFDRTAEVLLV